MWPNFSMFFGQFSYLTGSVSTGSGHKSHLNRSQSQVKQSSSIGRRVIIAVIGSIGNLLNFSFVQTYFLVESFSRCGRIRVCEKKFCRTTFIKRRRNFALVDVRQTLCRKNDRRVLFSQNFKPFLDFFSKNRIFKKEPSLVFGVKKLCQVRLLKRSRGET